MNTQTIAVFGLVTLAIGAASWVLILPFLSGERAMEKRKASVSGSGPVQRRSRGPQAKSKREVVEDTLKDIERKHGKRKLTLRDKIVLAGLTCSKNQFYMYSAILALATLLGMMFIGMDPLMSAAFAFSAGLGAPMWLLSFLRKRREKKFLNAFPDAVDVIVRGIKAGLPLLDSMRMIATESPEPVRSEFKAIMETQTIGIPISDAVLKLYENVPLPEANFFAIVIGIQAKAGGNLSEALGNLSRVLRERKKMKGKITAMSMEAKASASIIAALPISVMALVYITSPDYIELLWTTSLGRIMMAGSVLWMATGVFVMKKMINFDF